MYLKKYIILSIILPIGTSHVLLNSGLTITTTHVYLCQFHKGSSIPLKRNIITSTKQ